MNDICKERIRERLLEALKKEGLTTNLAGGMLKVNPTYLSMVKNPGLWIKVPEKDWELLQRWCNSGMGIAAYGNSGGKLVAGKVIIVPASSVEDVTESHSENVASERLHSDVEFSPITEESYNGNVQEVSIRKQAEVKEIYREKLTKVLPGMGAPDPIPAKTILKGKNDYEYSVNLAQIGWIIGMIQKGESIEHVARRLNIYPEIVKIIQENLKPYLPISPIPISEKDKELIAEIQRQRMVLDIEINILINGQRIKIG